MSYCNYDTSSDLSYGDCCLILKMQLGLVLLQITIQILNGGPDILVRSKLPWLDTVLNLNLANHYSKVDIMKANELPFHIKVLSNLVPKYLLAIFTYHKHGVSVQQNILIII